jgi:GGDEF domain-containing protein
LSVSVGVAVYPRDGDTLETLLSAADRSLYESKAQRPTKVRVQ